MNGLSVDCSFGADGLVQVRRVRLDGRWQAVGQGRQWLDGNGRHVLIMLPDNEVRRLTLRRATLLWELQPLRSTPQVV